MKFKISSKEFLLTLNKCLPAINPNPILPIIQDFKISLDGNTLTVSSTNLELTITTTTDAIGEVDGIMCVSAKDLTELLKNIPEQPISFNVDNNVLNIKSSVGSYDLPCDDYKEFPQLSTIESDKVTLSDSFIHAIGAVSFCTSSDDLRRAMTGVCLNCGNGKIEICATDAHKLGLFKVETDSDSFKIIIPKTVSNLIPKIYKSGDIEMIHNEGNVEFTMGNVVISSKLIDAKYPDYNAVIPVENPNTLTIERSTLIGSLKRLSTFTSSETNQVMIGVNDNTLYLKSSDSKLSKKANETISCMYQCDPMEIGVNAVSMIDILSKMSNKEITINMSTPNRAMIIESSDSDIYLLMPVMVVTN